MKIVLLVETKTAPQYLRWLMNTSGNQEVGMENWNVAVIIVPVRVFVEVFSNVDIAGGLYPMSLFLLMLPS